MMYHERRPKGRLLAAGAIAGLALTLAACSGNSTTSSGYGGSTPTVTTPAPTTAAATGSVTVQETKLGKVLANSQGMTLYVLTSDPKNGSDCTGQCATAWPPLTADSAPSDPSGSTAELTVFKRSDGTMQVASNGQALYTFQGDNAAGDVNGQDVKAPNGTWYAVGETGAYIDEG